MQGAAGFIGLGNMGLPMATNLAKAGYTLRVFDIQPAVREQVASLDGVQAVASAAEVADGCEILFTVLPNDEIVTRTYLDDGGIASAAKRGLITCDCSTVSPQVTASIHGALKPKGVHHMDTPMLGSKPQAVSGEIFFIVAGEEENLAKIAPLLDVMGKQHMYVGASSTGNQIKLIHNILGAVNSVAVAEALALCAQSGVDLETFQQVVAHGGGMAFSTYFGKRVQRIIAGDYSPQFTLELMHKDVTLAMNLARASDTPVPIMEETLNTYAAGLEGGWRGEDFSAVTHVIEKRIGRTLSKK